MQLRPPHGAHCVSMHVMQPFRSKQPGPTRSPPAVRGGNA